jgi:hypothetical protein
MMLLPLVVVPTPPLPTETTLVRVRTKQLDNQKLWELLPSIECGRFMVAISRCKANYCVNIYTVDITTSWGRDT